MAFLYHHVPMIGATSGIGAAMADRLVAAGVIVIAVGRRTDRLEAFTSKHATYKAKSMSFDIANREKTPQFAADAMKASPDIDCPEKVDLAEFDAEMNVNFSGFVALAHAFLPFLKSKKTVTSLVFTGSNLAIIPASVFPAYSASKAALIVFVLCLREQLRDTIVKVNEVSPPPVQTELHDNHIGEEAGQKLGMPLAAFTEEAYQGLVNGNDQIVIGSVGPKERFDEIVKLRRDGFEALSMMLRGPPKH